MTIATKKNVKANMNEKQNVNGKQNVKEKWYMNKISEYDKIIWYMMMIVKTVILSWMSKLCFSEICKLRLSENVADKSFVWKHTIHEYE